MKILCDTNVIARSLEPEHAQHSQACGAISELTLQGHELCVSPQVFFELWAVATRPVEQNGLRRTCLEAQTIYRETLSLFTLVPETSSVVSVWEDLVVKHNVTGKKSHDTHLAATMIVNDVTHLLTFNTQDFLRFGMITVIQPADVQKTP
ncbi:MAG: type II toxin-antitoxin system VapC family toxin [Gemmatales bacterium]